MSKDLPPGWGIHFSNSQKREYYFNRKTGHKYWIDSELPFGWVRGCDSSKQKCYFHIRDPHDKTYEKPTSKEKKKENITSPTPPPIPEPYQNENPSSRPDIRLEKDASSVNDPKPKVYTPSPVSRSKQSMDFVVDGLSPRTLSHEDVHTKNTPSSTTPEKTSRINELSHPIDNFTSPSPHIQSQENVNRSSGKKRPIEELSDQHVAKDFYDNLKRKSQQDRGNSLLFHMRTLNNWIKAILIRKYTTSHAAVLDLACGKGGDLMKWNQQNPSKYVGVDIAQQSLQDAISRLSHRHDRMDIRFCQADLGIASLSQDSLHCWNKEDGWHYGPCLHADERFDIISMQFAFHYLFGEEERARRFFQTIKEFLVPGGYFIATTVDCNVMVKELMKTCGKYEEDGSPSPIRFHDDMKRETCIIRFDNEVRDIILGYKQQDSLMNTSPFGFRYIFTLRDSETEGEGEAVNAPEYLIPNRLLQDLTDEYDLEIILQRNFQKFVNENTSDRENAALLDRMRVLNCKGTISDAEWEIAGLYQVLCFRRRR